MADDDDDDADDDDDDDDDADDAADDDDDDDDDDDEGALADCLPQASCRYAADRDFSGTFEKATILPIFIL